VTKKCTVRIRAEYGQTRSEVEISKMAAVRLQKNGSGSPTKMAAIRLYYIILTFVINL
jgi:hypothetical protein